MGPNDFELAFYGALKEGFEESEVKQNVAALFKASLDQVERMFSGNRVVIRNKLDMETAQKYVSAMAKRGAICKIEQMGQPGKEVEPGAVATVAAEIPPAAPVQSQSAEPLEKAGSPQNTVQSASQESESKIAGERVNEILASSQLGLDPVGVRLSDESEAAPELDLGELSAVEILPPGSDLQDEKEEMPVSVPDISHIKLKDSD